MSPPDMLMSLSSVSSKINLAMGIGRRSGSIQGRHNRSHAEHPSAIDVTDKIFDIRIVRVEQDVLWLTLLDDLVIPPKNSGVEQ